MNDKKLTVLENDVILKEITADEIVVTGNNVTLENCSAKTVTVTGERFIARECEFSSLSLEGAENALVAQSKLGALALNACFNCSLVLNVADAIKAADSKNVYVINNTVKGELAITDCNYVIADENSFATLKA